MLSVSQALLDVGEEKLNASQFELNIKVFLFFFFLAQIKLKVSCRIGEFKSRQGW